MKIPRAARDPEQLVQGLRSLLEARGTTVRLDPIPTWCDGPTLHEVADALAATVGLCTVAQEDYLGSPYAVEAHRRAPTLQVHRELSLLALVEAVLRLWAARGPLLDFTEDDRRALVAIVETGGSYPMQHTMARVVLDMAPTLGPHPAEIAGTIRALGYEHLWNEGFLALG